MHFRPPPPPQKKCFSGTSYHPSISNCSGPKGIPRLPEVWTTTTILSHLFTFGFITAEPRARSCAFKHASRTQVVLEAVAGFFFQTAVSYPHRIPRPECGYAEGHRQHHHPTGRHGDHKVRLGFQLSSSSPRAPACPSGC